MTSDPRLQQLASEAASKIKAISNERDEQIKRIYQEYRQQIEAIRTESSADSFGETSALLSGSTPINRSIHNIMPIADSTKFKREAKKCEVAIKMATFLEACVPPSYYDFALADLLHFTNEEALLELRQNTVWRSLEHEFISAGGLVCEWWDEPEPEETTPPASNKPKPNLKIRSRLTDILLATIAVSALAGSVAGWHFPYFSFPVLSQQDTTSNQ